MFLNSEREKGVWTLDNSIFCHFKILHFLWLFLWSKHGLGVPLLPHAVEDQLKPRGPEIEKNPVISPGHRALKPKYYVTVGKWATQEAFSHLELSALGPQGMTLLSTLPFGYKPTWVTCGNGPPDLAPSKSSEVVPQRALPTHTVCSGLFFKVHGYPFPQLLPLLRGLVQFMLQSFNFLQSN